MNYKGDQAKKNDSRKNNVFTLKSYSAMQKYAHPTKIFQVFIFLWRSNQMLAEMQS